MKTHPGDPSEAFGAFIAEQAAHGGPKVEFATFSGTDADWRKDGGAVYLRLRCHTRIDGDGESYELWARLLAPGGLWWIPRAETEVMLLCPPNLDTNPGAAWCMMTAQFPPEKVSRDKAFLSLPSDTTLLATAAGFLFKAIGVTLNIDDGKFVLSFPNGTRFEGDESGFRLVACDAMGVATAMWIDATGISVACAPLATPKLTWKLDGLSGSVMSQGLGPFMANHTMGFLGVAPVGPIAYGPGPSSLASATWKVSP